MKVKLRHEQSPYDRRLWAEGIKQLDLSQRDISRAREKAVEAARRAALRAGGATVGQEEAMRRSRGATLLQRAAGLLPAADRERQLEEWRDHLACVVEDGGRPRRVVWSLLWRGVVPLAIRGRVGALRRVG